MLSNAGMRPKTIASVLTNQDNGIIHMKNIYNEVSASRREMLNGHRPVVALPQMLHNGFFDFAINSEPDGHLKSFFAHNQALQLYHLYSSVILKAWN
jgi:hypothetical protein